MLTALLLLIAEGCATTIHDHTFCSPLPVMPDGTKLGAVCDNFLTHKPQTLNEIEWQALQTAWMAKGYAIEVTESNAVGDIKKELEELCSRSPCNEDTTETVQALIQTLTRMQNVAEKSKSMLR